MATARLRFALPVTAPGALGKPLTKILDRPEVKAWLEDLKANPTGAVAQAIALHEQRQDQIARIKDLQRLARISMGDELVKREFAVRNKETGLEEMVEAEVTVTDFPTALKALQLLLAESDRLEAPRMRKDARHDKKVLAARGQLRALLEP
jgi:hypothetical protein